ncbi:MAG: serine/threonine protein kinase, partial [Candidatus Sericytochromatia bacterium]
NMARTHLAVDQHKGLEVVVKELTLSGLDNWKAYDLFEREAKTLGQLRHERIPALVDYFRIEAEEDLRLYIVSERVSGVSLAEKLDAGWHLEESEAIAIARQILGILVYLQGLLPPVVHRDIKPSNLLLSDDGRVSLVDFGAVQSALRPKGGSTVVGTFGYMAPEQFSGRAVPASDLYSLGATLVHMLAGISPAEMNQEGLRLRFRQHLRCSAALATWLEKLLEPAAEKRPQSAVVALAALERISGGASVLYQEDKVYPEQVSAAGPPGTKVSLHRKKEQLFIEIPPQSSKNRAAVLNVLLLAIAGFMAFAVSLDLLRLSWFFLLLGLPLGLGGLAFSAWMLSFFARQVLVLLTPKYIQLETHYGGFQSGHHRIVYKDLTGIRLQRGSFPQATQALVLEEAGTKQYAFGHLLRPSEKKWLQDEILGYLENVCEPEQFARLKQEAEYRPLGPGLPTGAENLGELMNQVMNQALNQAQHPQAGEQIPGLHINIRKSVITTSSQNSFSSETVINHEQLADMVGKVLQQQPDSSFAEFEKAFIARYQLPITAEILKPLYLAQKRIPPGS